jgi:hypothetical protein
MQRKTGYSCPRADCDFTTPSVVDMSVHTSGHKTVVTKPQPTWLALDAMETVLGTADDLEGRFALAGQFPHAQIVHRIEYERISNGG